MKDMKKLLNVLTTLGFATVTGLSTVACNSNIVGSRGQITDTVLKDLGVYTSEGNSLVEAVLNGTTISWNVSLLENSLNASNLLTNENKAKSEDSFNFLVMTLKLVANGESKLWNEKTFVKEDAQKIKLIVNEINPELKPIENDFAIKGGTVSVKWINDKGQLGNEYKIALKASDKGIVADVLPGLEELTLADFNTTELPLSDFVVGQSKDSIKENTDITALLDTDSEKGKDVKTLATLINQGDFKVTVTSNNAIGAKFVKGDTLVVKISFGSVQFSTGYELVVAEPEASSI